MNIQQTANEWLIYDTRLKELTKQTKELRKAKAELAQQIKDYMKKEGLGDFSVEEGTIILEVKTSAPRAVSKKGLKDTLDNLDLPSVSKDSELLCESVFRKLPVSTSETLKRKPERKSKKSRKVVDE